MEGWCRRMSWRRIAAKISRSRRVRTRDGGLKGDVLEIRPIQRVQLDEGAHAQRRVTYSVGRADRRFSMGRSPAGLRHCGIHRDAHDRAEASLPHAPLDRLQRSTASSSNGHLGIPRHSEGVHLDDLHPGEEAGQVGGDDLFTHTQESGRPRRRTRLCTARWARRRSPRNEGFPGGCRERSARSAMAASDGGPRTWRPPPARSRRRVSEAPRESRRAPQGVGLGHPSDERSDLRGDSRTAWPVPAALPGPDELEAGRCHRITVAGWTTRWHPSSRPTGGTAGPRTSGQRFQPWTRPGALEDDQLVPQREVLEHEGLAGPEHAEEGREDEDDHAGIIDQVGRQFNVDEADGVNRGHSTER